MLVDGLTKILPSLEARSVDKVIEFGRYSILDQLIAISAIFAISATVTLPFTTPKTVSKFLFWYSFYLYLFSIALTTPSNLGGCVSDYRHCAETRSPLGRL